MPEINNNLRMYRKLMGYCKSDMAPYLGLTRTRKISLWEKGKAYPSLIELIKLCAIFKATPYQLYGEPIQKVEKEMTLLLLSEDLPTIK